ncbi:MAG: 3-hydroxyisobutyrate dehydrogenase [Alphaproteobacteria bacterium]
MATVGFIGLGNMGLPMAKNLLKAGHSVKAFDLNGQALAAAAEAGAEKAEDTAAAAKGVEAVITMLPAGDHVLSVYGGDQGVVAAAGQGTLLIDCSTIDMESARQVSALAADKGLTMVDAPVSGGVAAAEAGGPTFMVGGPAEGFEGARPLLEAMGKNVFHAGESGNGQAAKICNNMILAVSMIGVCEAFVLAEKLGLDHQKLFDIASTASGQCWSLTSYCPVPGPVPASPANRDYKAGFTAAMMLKDLKLAQNAAQNADAVTPLGAEATSLYGLFAASGESGRDFSGIINMIRGKAGG